MATALTLIQDAASLFGMYAEDTDLSDVSAQLILRHLNRLLDSSSNERLMVNVMATETFPTVAGTASYASSVLGGSGRPLKVDSVNVTLDGSTFPVDLVDNRYYNEIAYKAAQGTPEVMYASMAYPTATFYFYPTPDDVYTVNLATQRVLSSALTLATSVSLPPGYEAWIVNALAVVAAPSFGTVASEEVKEAARIAKGNLKRANATPVPEMAVLLGGVRPNIFVGE